MWSDDEESFASLDKKSKTLLEEMRKICSWDGKTYYDGDIGWEFEVNHSDLVERAFDIFVERILGRSNSGLKLEVLRESCYGEEDPKMFIIYKPTKIEPDTGADDSGHAYRYRGGVNVPWGQRAVDLPMKALDSKKVSDEIQKVCDALGATCIGKLSWKIISSAGGG